jgi:hypothetical protein
MTLRSLGRDGDGLEQFFGYDDASDRYILRTTFDNEPTLDRNKALQNEDGFGKGKDMWLAASIPVGVQYEWMTKHGINMWDKNHKAAVRRLLNSNEYRYLRINHFML